MPTHLPSQDGGVSCLKNNANCGWVNDPNYMYFGKTSPTPPIGPADITVNFAAVRALARIVQALLVRADPTPRGLPYLQVGLRGPVEVYDIWQRQSLGVHSTSFTQTVPAHGTGFLRLKPFSA
jgi:hypothetical protein